MIILKYLSIALSIILLSSQSFAKETKYSCKPKVLPPFVQTGFKSLKLQVKKNLLRLQLEMEKVWNQVFF
jgi:hypothetical protein